MQTIGYPKPMKVNRRSDRPRRQAEEGPNFREITRILPNDPSRNGEPTPDRASLRAGRLDKNGAEFPQTFPELPG